MPAQDGLRLDEDERTAPSGPEPREVGPQKSIGGPKPDGPSRALALEDEELVAEGEHLGVERSSAPDERPERGKNSPKGRGHPRLSLTYLVENLNVFTADHVFGKDR